MVRALLSPSRLLTAVLALVHAAAIAIVFPLQIPLEWKAVLLAVIAASLAQSIRRHGLLRSRQAIAEIEVSDCERASVRLRSGEWRHARILGTSCVTPALAVLNFRVEGLRTTRHAVLVRDSIDAEDFRTVRVLLRWARPEKAPRPAESPSAYDA